MIHRPLIPLLPLLAALTTLPVALELRAERADRAKPMTVDADKPGSVDLQRQVIVFNGNVSVTQGTLNLRAERVELRETKDGQRQAMALGSSERPAYFRQKLDTPGESVEASAERIEYDSRTETLKFLGAAQWRRLRGSELADEVLGHTITWDSKANVVQVAGGVATPLNPSGRIRAVFAPRADAAASAPGSAASAAEPVPLRPSRSLGGERP